MAHNFLRAARLRLGLRQSELAQHLDITQGSVSRFETGILPIDRRMQLAIRSLLAGAGTPESEIDAMVARHSLSTTPHPESPSAAKAAA